MAVDVRFVQDTLRGDNVTEIRMKFIKRIEENLPAGDEWWKQKDLKRTESYKEHLHIQTERMNELKTSGWVAYPNSPKDVYFPCNFTCLKWLKNAPPFCSTFTSCLRLSVLFGEECQELKETIEIPIEKKHCTTIETQNEIITWPCYLEYLVGK